MLPLLESIVIRDAAKIAHLQGLPNTCLDATLVAVVSDRLRTTVMAWGDGLIHFQGRRPCSAESSWYLLRNEGAAPYYLSYLLEPDRDRRYLETYAWPSSFRIEAVPGAADCIESPGAGERVSFYREYMHTDLAPFTLTVSSDGIGAFTSELGQAIPVSNLIDDMTSFKNLHGEFVHRRLSKFLKSAERRGWTYMDDLSLATTVVEVEP